MSPPEPHENLSPPLAAPVSGAPSMSAPIVTVHSTKLQGATAAALEICDLLDAKPDAVLGLATGGTMVGVYGALVEEVQRRGLDVSRVTTFNLDEYLGLDAGDPRLFRHFMDEHLFVPLGFNDAQVHFPDHVGARPRGADAVDAARQYEEAIQAAGGIDLQLLGIGRNGHIAFNEPGSSPRSRTRVVELHEVTRRDAAETFGGFDETPERAITMGLGTILEARALRVLAFGASKAPVVERLLRGAEDLDIPCTFLRERHGDIAVHLDIEAARLLP